MLLGKIYPSLSTPASYSVIFDSGANNFISGFTDDLLDLLLSLQKNWF